MSARRITIVLPFVHLTGGIRMMLDHANALHRAGHRVLVVYPAWPYRFNLSRRQWVQELRGRLAAPVRVPWFTLEATLRRVAFVRGACLPRADVVVATSWPTAHDVAKLPACCGFKVHVAMHDEAGTGPVARVSAAYTLRLWRITLSQTVRSQFERECGVTTEAVVPAGVDARVFYPDGQRQPGTLLMLYHPDPRKGAAHGFAAIDRVRQVLPDVRVLACGQLRPPRVPDGVDWVHAPDDAGLRRLYSTATILLYPSCYEGFGLPPLEAMACGCPVVTTAVGAVPEFAVNGENALIVPPGDSMAMANAIGRIVRDPDLQGRLSVAGRHTARQWTTSTAAALFERAVIGAADAALKRVLQ